MSSNKMEHSADINFQDSPLMMGLEISNDEVFIRNLLAVGADVNKVDSQGRTPLLRYLQREDCSVDIVKVLLDFKADVNRMVKGKSPLVTAIRNSKNDAVIDLLVERGAEVNDLTNSHNNTPLLVLLRERKDCSVDTVKLLLANGADINCVDKCGCFPLGTALISRDEVVIQALLDGGANVNMVCKFSLYSYSDSPLLIALKHSRKEKIIRILLENHADVNTLDPSFKSPLCIAFRHSSNDIVKLLLDAGSSPSVCKYHPTSALYCATNYSYSGLREDILKVLLQTNVDVNIVDNYGQSVLCFALQHGAQAQDIRLLLDSGASLNVCKQHSSPLRCATDTLPSNAGSPLREDVVQLLLDNGSSMNDEGLEVLQSALRSCNYETGAIQLLLDIPGMDAYVLATEGINSLLHLAVQNPYCKLETVKLLINRKAQVNSTNQNGETPLHCAIRIGNESCDPSVINLLLQNGSPVNAKNKSNETPLVLAVKELRPAGILKELLMSGAHIGKLLLDVVESRFDYFESKKLQDFKRFSHGYPQILEKLDEILDSHKMLMKFFLIQNPECVIGDFKFATGVRSGDKEFFMNKCLSELGKMDSLQVGHGHTFRMFVSRNCPAVEEMYDVNQILICLMKNTFSAYFDVISARIGRSIMEAEVKKLQVYTNKLFPDLLYGERIHLNTDVVLKISQYLPDDDLLNFILAFYKPVDPNNSGEASKDEQ